jgi:hypothetical protein
MISICCLFISQYLEASKRLLLCVPCCTKESRRLVVPRTSCFIQNHWVSRLCPQSAIRNTRKHSGSETASVSVLRWGEGDTCSVGSLNHWIQTSCFIASLSVLPLFYSLCWANSLPNHHTPALLSLQVAKDAHGVVTARDWKECTAGVRFLAVTGDFVYTPQRPWGFWGSPSPVPSADWCYFYGGKASGTPSSSADIKNYGALPPLLYMHFFKALCSIN